MILHYQHQENAVKELEEKSSNYQNNLLLIGAAGVGKAYILGSYLKNLIESNEYKTLIENHKAFPLMFLTDDSAVSQTREVLYGEFKIPSKKLLIFGYSKIRSTLGTIFLKWHKQILSTGEEKHFCIWNKDFQPLLIIADECQKLRNPTTLQTKTIDAFLHSGQGNIILSSATPFTKIDEAKITTIALQPTFSQQYGRTINDKNWPEFARDIAGVLGPSMHNSEAIKRLTAKLEHRIVRVKNVKFKHRTFTKCKLIPFDCEEDRERYNDAYEKFLLKLAKINRDEPGGIAAIWTAQLMFRMEAELIRAKALARIGLDSVKNNNKQVIIGSNFVGTLEAILNELLKQGVPRERISVIRGGQTTEERDLNRKRFQNGETDFCLLTLKSGGVGISLHHHEGNKNKCKPRYCLLPPTWSAIEIVQLLGRGHRINSISTTRQDIIWFQGTIEEKVANKLELKLHCLGELVGKKETWTGVMSQRDELDSWKELTEKYEEEIGDKNEEGDSELFANEAFNNDPTGIIVEDYDPSLIKEKQKDGEVLHFSKDDITL